MCITFRRWFPDTDQDIVTYTFPIDTDEQKVLLAEHFIDHGDIAKNFINGRMEKTVLAFKRGLDDMCGYYAAVQFFQSAFVEGSAEPENKSMTFPFNNNIEKIAFANWLIEKKLGDFRDENTHIFVSVLHRHQLAE